MTINGLIMAGKITSNTKLYRYIKLSQFMCWVETQKTYLTKVKYWKDIWEVPASKLKTSQYYEKGITSESLSDEMFGQCWSLNGESDALWRIYSTNKEGLLIQTTVDKFKMLKEIKFGMLAPVIYYKSLKMGLDELEDRKDYNKLFGQAYLKRSAFNHEQEVRLLTMNNSQCLVHQHDNTDHIYLNLSPTEFIENIIIDPRSSDWYVETVQRYCRRSDFKFTPTKSDLYSTNIYEATHLTTDSFYGNQNINSFRKIFH